MIFDDMEASYFAFLRDQGARTTDSEVLAAMNKFEDVHLATKIAALKEISNGTRIGAVPSVPGAAPGERALGAPVRSGGTSSTSRVIRRPPSRPSRPPLTEDLKGVGLKK